ncbi:uncharacterized protein V6R79_023740 [Siganus canaliculatus]
MMTSPLIHHLTGWNAAVVIANPLIMIGDCGGMLITTAVARHLIYLDDEYGLAALLHGGFKPSDAGLTARQTRTDS